MWPGGRRYRRASASRRNVVDVQDPGGRLLLEPLPRVSLEDPCRLRQLGSRHRARAFDGTIEPEGVAEVDREHLRHPETRREQPLNEFVTLRDRYRPWWFPPRFELPGPSLDVAETAFMVPLGGGDDRDRRSCDSPLGQPRRDAFAERALDDPSFGGDGLGGTRSTWAASVSWTTPSTSGPSRSAPANGSVVCNSSNSSVEDSADALDVLVVGQTKVDDRAAPSTRLVARYLDVAVRHDVQRAVERPDHGDPQRQCLDRSRDGPTVD